MNLRIRRRRFGQLALASAATAALGSLASKVNAQTTTAAISGLVGVGLTTTNTSSTQPSLTPSLTPSSVISPIIGNVLTLANNTPTINLVDLSGTKTIASTTVDNPGTIFNLVNNAVSTQSQRIASLTPGLDGTTLVTATVTHAQNIAVSQLTFISPNSTQPSRAVILSGFTTPNAVIESVLAMQNGQYLGIVSLNGGIPPFELAMIDPDTGKVTSGKQLADLKPDSRYSNLTNAPDGSIYATTLGREGRTGVVKIDLNNKSLITGKATIVRILDLSINNEPLDNDVLSLAFSSTGILYALANPTRQQTNSVYTVDTNNKGTLTPVTTIGAQKITILNL
ncbi:MAG: hypothetical protein DSM106950_17090 [Stigonema ocellatum SAG 48.90 = DSM 106950]|nr:hypothetical protein [Stigonema ocellatum SAG 48.90 = DSM 106950]